MPRRPLNAPIRAAGFSLVELMVAITLSLLLLTGVVAIFSSSRVSYDSTLQLSRIQDTGRGFDAAACAEGQVDSCERGIGLQSMSARAAALGGVCEVQSRPGLGTTVCIRIQLLATAR